MSALEPVQAYYRAFSDKTDFSEVPIAEGVVFKGPMGERNGAEELRASLAGLAQGVQGLAIRHQLSAEDQVVSIYDFDLGGPSGPIPMAERLSIRGGEIVEIELLFDPQRLAG